MNDFANFEKTVRELSCRLCLCNDVVKLKPLSSEVKRRLKKLFDITVRTDDSLPKAICHDCLQQVSSVYLYAVKVEKTQKFLEFHKLKTSELKNDNNVVEQKLHPIIGTLSSQKMPEGDQISSSRSPIRSSSSMPAPQQDDTKSRIKKSAMDAKLVEAMSIDEFAISEKLDRRLLSASPKRTRTGIEKREVKKVLTATVPATEEPLDPVVLIDGKPAKQGAALDKQISLFYKMECCICHETGFSFRSLMKHYKDRHGVPGYVTCCDKKFHYFYPKKIIEHMAYHLQPNIFMCQSCHHNFQTSQELTEHQSNGGRSEGKITCPKCSDRYPTYRELGCHLITHRVEKMQCDYCGKALKHHHRKKTVNHMEDVILCYHCTRLLKNIEKQEKEIKEKIKPKSGDVLTTQKHQKFKQAMGLSGDEDGSTE